MIKYWNREAEREEQELVYGDRPMKFIYETKPGQLIADAALARAPLSRAYGWYQSSPLSRRKIAPFVRDFKIDMEEYEKGPFRSFNDFFIRRFRPGKREFTQVASEMPAFAEARYVAFDKIESSLTYPVKGEHLTPAAILGDTGIAREFEGGPLFIARLCPVDYHRFHFPDDGRTLQQYRVHGPLHSVNPVALRYKGEILSSNEREVSILETRNFGRLAYIEVGALCVGLIVQSHPKDRPFQRGGEKGYFLFGASTVIVIGQPGKWKPDADLLERTRAGQETFVKLGARIATT